MFNASIIFISQLIHIKIVSNLKRERMEKKSKKGERMSEWRKQERIRKTETSSSPPKKNKGRWGNTYE